MKAARKADNSIAMFTPYPNYSFKHNKSIRFKTVKNNVPEAEYYFIMPQMSVVINRKNSFRFYGVVRQKTIVEAVLQSSYYLSSSIKLEACTLK